MSVREPWQNQRMTFVYHHVRACVCLRILQAEVLTVLHWLRQIVGIVTGIVLGVAGVTGSAGNIGCVPSPLSFILLVFLSPIRAPRAGLNARNGRGSVAISESGSIGRCGESERDDERRGNGIYNPPRTVVVSYR